MNMPVMRNSPQQYGSQFPDGSVSMTQSLFAPNNMAQSGQMPNARGCRWSPVPPSPAQQQQYGHHQMQRQPSVMGGSTHYTPEQQRQTHAQLGAGAVPAQYQQHSSASEAVCGNMPHNANHAARPVPLSIPSPLPTGHKRRLDNATGPPSKRRASQNPVVNGLQMANFSAQNQQWRQNLHPPDAISRAHSVSAAMAQQQNPLTPIALVGGSNTSAMMNQIGRTSTQSPEQYQQFLAERQRMQQNQHVTQQGVQTRQGAQAQQQGMQNHQHVQNRQPTQQPFQIQRQQSQNPHSIHTPQLGQNQQHAQHQQHQQNSTINEQRIQTPHQSNTQVGVSSEQHSSSVQHQQRVPYPHQFAAQNGDSRQPQSQSAQALQQISGAVKTAAFEMIRQIRLQNNQSTDMQLNPATQAEMAKLRPYLEQYKVNYHARIRHNAAAQVAAPNHTQFLQQNFAPQQQRPQQQTTPQQLEVQQQLARQPQQEAIDQQRGTQQYLQDQQQFLPEGQQTLKQNHPVQQAQNRQQLESGQQKQQVATVSGKHRASVSSTSSSLVAQNKHRQGSAGSPPAATTVTSSYPLPDREDHISSSPPQQLSAQYTSPKDDIEVRLEEGIKTFLRESASPEQSFDHTSSSSQVADSLLAPQSSRQSTSSAPTSAMPVTPQSCTGGSGAVTSRPEKPKQSQVANIADPSRAFAAQQRATNAPGPEPIAAPVQQASFRSPSTSHTDNGSGHVICEQSRPCLEGTSSTVSSGSPHGDSGADISATIEGASDGSLTTTNPELDFLNSITNPGGDWQLLDRAEAGYGLYDQAPSPALLPDDAWVDATPLSDPPIGFAGEDGVDRLLGLSNRKQNLRNFLHPEEMTAGEGSNVAQKYGYDWNESHWDCIRDIMAPNETQRPDRQAEEELKPVVEVEPVFASHTGPYTSVADAFNHRMNQELGVGWEVHRDPSAFPNREAGLVDWETLKMIENGTYLATSFEFGNVNDAVARPGVNGEVEFGKE